MQVVLGGLRAVIFYAQQIKGPTRNSFEFQTAEFKFEACLFLRPLRKNLRIAVKSITAEFAKGIEI